MFMTKTIFANLMSKYATRLHPFEQRVLPDGFRGRFKFAIDKCILCRQCAIKCPTKVIDINAEKGIWHREVMGCLYCGVCADVCPTGCITMTNVYRPPITEPAFLTFHVTPRPAKKKTQAGAASPKEIQEALEKKVEEREAKPAVSKTVAVEEEAVEPAHTVEAEQETPKADAKNKKRT